MKLDLARNLPVNVSFDIALRLSGQTIPCGQFWAHRPTVGVPPNVDMGWTCTNEELTVDLPRPGPEVKQANVVLTPNPQPLERVATVDRIWGKEIIFRDVPLNRQDL